MPAEAPATHRYRAFGLEIRSEVVCPEFLPGRGEYEVEVRLGFTPDWLQAPWEEGACFEVAGSRLLFLAPEAGRFLVEDGRTITVTPAEGADPDLVRVFLLGSVFGALLQQRGLLTLHGSALLGRRGAFLLTGESGAGKSTTAAFLAAQGLPVLSDDVCAVSFPPEGPPLLHPAYPRLHLRPDAVAAVGPDPARLHDTRKAVEKLGLDLRDGFQDAPQPLRTVFWLEPSPTGALAWEMLEGLDRLTALAQNSYRNWYLAPMGRLGAHFRQAAAVADAARVYRIRRPADLDTLSALADLLLELEAREP